VNKEEGASRRIILSKWMIGVLILLFGVIVFFLGLGVSSMDDAGEIWEWANAYADLLSFFAAAMLVCVTIIYVQVTHSMAEASEKSTELMTKQIQLSKQPCVLPEAFPTWHESGKYDLDRGWELNLHFFLENYGDSPAISVKTLAYIELQYLYDEPKKFPMSGSPCITSILSTKIMPNKEASESVLFHFDSSVLSLILQDMNTCRTLHPIYNSWSGGSDNYGPIIVVKTLYQNLLGEKFIGIFKKRIRYFSLRKNIGSNVIPVIPDLTTIAHDGEANIYVSYASDNSSETDFHLASDEDVLEFEAYTAICKEKEF